ncbi:MAG: hypothetical protein K2M46_12750 [Lachnospiraceae bacterium]|nr:hypothetical protein [Lachnospiraceae bacterium]
MRVKNISIRAFEKPELREKKGTEKGKSKTIKANELNFMEKMSPEERRRKKEKQALKIRLNQMASDVEYSEQIKEHLEKRTEYEHQTVENQAEVKKNQELKAAAMEQYQVSANSKEEKLAQEIAGLRMKKNAGQKLTKEEEERLAKTDDLTDYQKSAIQYMEAIDEYGKRANRSRQMASAHQQAAEDMKLELLKVHPMVDANKEAKAIVDDALREEQLGLIDEAKEKYDEKMEEQKEQGENINERSKELHGTEETKEQKQMKNLLELAENKELQEAVEEKSILLKEDLKGIEVDEYL